MDEIVKGGQGRSGSEVKESGCVWAFVVLGMCATLGLVVIAFLMGLRS